MKGTIFDIKEFSIHDGPGARVTVFMKGCPLKCVWCHNPEGLSINPQLMYKKNICTQCSRCFVPCNHEECKPFARCIHSCANGCLSLCGMKVSVDELVSKVLKNSNFFAMAGGGVTVSGGEPLMQGEFVCEFANKLKGIHKALQTSGYSESDLYKKVIHGFDFIMQDIKLADEKQHIRYTGVSNKKILKNIEYLKMSGKDFVFRVPLIPGITDTKENLMAISEIVEDFPVELLRYNSLAGAKYGMLGMEYTLSDTKNAEDDFTMYFKNAKME